MSDQRLTDAELAAIERRADITDSVEYVCDESTMNDLRRLLAEVDRLRTALTAISRNEQAAANRSLELQEENDRLRAENTAQAERIAELASEVVATASRNCTLQAENDLLRPLDQSGEGQGNG